MKKPRKNKRSTAKLTPTILTATPAKQEAALRHIEKRIAAGDRITRAELKIYYELEKITNPESIRGVKEAAAYCGMTERILRYDLGRQRLKANPDGTFDRAEIDRWVSSRDGREKPPEDACVSKKDKKARADYWVEKAKTQKIIRKNLAGEMVEKSEVNSMWASRALGVKSDLYSWVDRLPPLLVGHSREEIRDVLLKEITGVLETYARAGKHTPEVK